MSFSGREEPVNLLLKTAIPLFLIATAVNADTLILRDGRRIEGQLISYQNGVIAFQQAGPGGVLGEVSKNDVLGIEFGSAGNGSGRGERQGTPQASQGPPRGMRQKQVTVVANQAWTDTGIDLTSGQSVYFESVGEIGWGPGRHSDANGEANSPNNNARPIPNRPGGSLIGRVGSQSDPFFIGSDHRAFPVRGSGRLFLGINDDYLQDNSGYFRVTVYY
jgi:hypothetical protein